MSIEELFGPFHWWDYRYLLVFYLSQAIVGFWGSVRLSRFACYLLVLCNYLIPSIGQTILRFSCILQVSGNPWSLGMGEIVNTFEYVTPLERLFDFPWSAIRLTFACILRVLSNFGIPGIGNTIKMCLYFASVGQLLNPLTGEILIFTYILAVSSYCWILGIIQIIFCC